MISALSVLEILLLLLIHHTFAFVSPLSARPPTSLAATESLTLFSPCKINLFLRILRKREDGYHDLASLFQAIALGDTLELRLAPADQFACNMPGVPVDDTNLVVRALNLIKSKTDRPDVFFDCTLTKQVPAQAGLGGGSANAATAMWGANELLGRPATLEQLVEWSADLGSDITFFLSEGTAYCTGRGEILEPVPALSSQQVCIVKPNVGLSTPRVFGALDYDLLSDVDPQDLLKRFQSGKLEDSMFINDLEAPAFVCLPELKDLKDELCLQGFDHVLMSGSGTSIYCLGMPKDPEGFAEEFGSRDTLQVFFSEFMRRNPGEWYSP